MRKLLLAVVLSGVIALVTSCTASAPPAPTPPDAGIRLLSTAKSKGWSMKTVIKKAKRKNRASFNKRLRTIKKSAALVAIVKRANKPRHSLYMEFFAATITQKKAKRLVKKTAGKHFVVTGTKSRPQVRLISNLSVLSKDGGIDLTPTGFSCWQGWVAFWAYWLGAEMTCTAFGAAVGAGMSPTGPVAVGGGIFAGAACNGLMSFLQAQFIDFESACNRTYASECTRNSRFAPMRTTRTLGVA